jgi:hypothetical protein
VVVVDSLIAASQRSLALERNYIGEQRLRTVFVVAFSGSKVPAYRFGEFHFFYRRLLVAREHLRLLDCG